MKYNPLRYTLPLILLFLLTACASLSPTRQPFNQPLPWHIRQAQLSHLQAWRCQGVTSIYTSKQHITASLHWTQNKHHYQIDLFGPLGMGAVHIDGAPHHITLYKANGQKFTATSPEALLKKQLGWSLPLSNLYYWIRGLPVPNVPAHKTFDRYHHLVTLHQHNWQIDYVQYTGVSQHDLPRKIALRNPKITVKIVIARWQIT